MAFGQRGNRHRSQRCHELVSHSEVTQDQRPTMDQHDPTLHPPTMDRHDPYHPCTIDHKITKNRKEQRESWHTGGWVGVTTRAPPLEANTVLIDTRQWTTGLGQENGSANTNMHKNMSHLVHSLKIDEKSTAQPPRQASTSQPQPPSRSIQNLAPEPKEPQTASLFGSRDNALNKLNAFISYPKVSTKA